MLKILKQAFTGGIATKPYRAVLEEPPDGFRGKPEIDYAHCTACDTCALACPTSALTVKTETAAEDRKTVSLDYGDCIFCGECERACPAAIRLTKEFALAVTDRADLVKRATFERSADGIYRCVNVPPDAPSSAESVAAIGATLKAHIDRLFGRSLHIREVDAGSCNGCEVEITALNNPVYDIERFGIHFVASPRHADMLLVTGPVTRNMENALKLTYEATPGPKIVVAVGACAIGGGVFGRSYASAGGVDAVIPVDVFIPGCPPRPEALLHGILTAIERYPDRDAAGTQTHAV